MGGQPRTPHRGSGRNDPHFNPRVRIRDPLFPKPGDLEGRRRRQGESPEGGPQQEGEEPRRPLVDAAGMRGASGGPGVGREMARTMVGRGIREPPFNPRGGGEGFLGPPMPPISAKGGVLWSGESPFLWGLFLGFAECYGGRRGGGGCPGTPRPGWRRSCTPHHQ